jgi:transposase
VLPKPGTALPNSLLKRVARSYMPSEKAQALEEAATHGVSAASDKPGMSRFSIYDWQRKLAKAAAGGGPSPTSGPAPQAIEEQRNRETLGEGRKHPGLGPSQIRNQLRRRGVKVSVTTARRVMEDDGYRPPKVVREPHDERFEAVRPNHLWHLDFVHRHMHQASTFTLILIDDCARFVTGHGVDDAERAEIFAATNANREDAYEIADAIFAALPALEQSLSQPGSEPAVAHGVGISALVHEALGFVMRHPGCAQSSAPARYTAGYRRFVLALRKRYADLPASEYADVLALPLDTLEGSMAGG